MPTEPIWSLPRLKSLIEDKVPESRTLDYKAALLLKGDESIRDFIKDVTSLANSAGGTILYGVQAEGLFAKELPGITIEDLDKLTRQMDDILRNGAQPYVRGIRREMVQIENGKHVLALIVPQSLEAPHMIMRDPREFWARADAANYRPDVYQLRDAFLASGTLVERVQNFRLSRLSAIENEQAPLALEQTARVVLQVMPAASFARGTVVDLDSLYRDRFDIFPRFEENFRHDQLYCLEGLLQSASLNGVGAAFALLYRNGCLEVVDANSCGSYSQTGGPLFYPYQYERRIRESLANGIKLLEKLGVPPPYFVALAVLRCRDFGLYRGSAGFHSGYKKLERDRIVLPERSIESWDGNVDVVLRPLFDMIFNAFAYPRSTNYDKEGVWAPRDK